MHPSAERPNYLGEVEAMSPNPKEQNGLRPGFTPLGIWAFSIGTSIGWGSFIVTCSTYLQKSGVLGTAFGLLIGMAVIFVITWNLQYMIRVKPDAGGIYSFEKHTGGKDFGFLAAWFVLLTYLAVLWANITSLPLFARFFLGSAFHFGFHYQIFCYEVWLGEALLSICALVLIALLCSRSSRLANRIMVIAAGVFTLGFTLCAVIALFRHDSAFSYSPLYNEGSSAFAQIVRIAAISPWAFIGFENVSHFSEEYDFPIKRVRGILIWSLAVTTLLYLFVSLLSVSAYPPEYESWLAYIQDMGNLDGVKAVPAFYAAEHYLGQAGVTVLMLALFGVILTSLIGNMLALSRLLYAAGREGEAPKPLARLNDRGIPRNAIFSIAAVSVMIPFLGRTAIGWIVDVTTLGATLIYGMISHAVFKHARDNRVHREQITGAAGMILMIAFMLLLLIPGLLPFDAMETESYVLFIVWAVLGLIYFRALVRRDQHRNYGQRVIVWVILLVLMLFASMMWVSRATENAADTAVRRIYEYHQSHPEHDTEEEAVAERAAYLQEQADQITKTNTLYTVVSLGLFIISTTIMLNNYKDTREMGERLTAAEEAAAAARKIAELKASITALLNNMPAMSFSKDAETGAYLACNQAFAEYCHKKDPEGVTGLTDAEIFDAETARHFTEDDRMALSMDHPYVFFEDVPDAAGNQRQFQTTKLKYIDDTGRLCLLGMCEDITDKVRMQRENVSTKEAYEKARNAGLVYTRIAQTLARGYTDLFYVNLETEEYIEYATDSENSMLKERSRGGRFFDQCKVNIEKHVFADDREAFLRGMSRDALLDALERNKTIIMTYRRMTNGKPAYVTMKISHMEDDHRFIVVGVSDVDEQVKQQRAAERMAEERIAYARLNALTGDMMCAFIVVPETGRYRQYSAATVYDGLGLPQEGEDFFSVMRDLSVQFVCQEDLGRFRSLFTRENVLAAIERNGIFSLSYRLKLGDRRSHVQIKAAMVEEKEGARMIVGINDIDSSVRQEEEYARRLAQAKRMANIDALTGVKNKHAFLEAEESINYQIIEKAQPEFAVVVLDVNDLKRVNDTEGHQAGDQYLRDACKLICDIFKRSPVFRVGGDEFAVISQGSDYTCMEELIEKVNGHNEEAVRSGGIVVACGMAKFDNDACVAAVYERADHNMYENKNILKSGKK